jgi:hypothetical protein
MFVRLAVLDWGGLLTRTGGRGTGIHLCWIGVGELAEQGAGDVPAVVRFVFGRAGTGLRVDGSLAAGRGGVGRGGGDL